MRQTALHYSLATSRSTEATEALIRWATLAIRWWATVAIRWWADKDKSLTDPIEALIRWAQRQRQSSY